MKTSKGAIFLPGDSLPIPPGYKVIGSFSEVRGKHVICTTITLVSIKGTTIKLVPLKGVYIPNIGDKVIGIAKHISVDHCIFDINSPYPAILQINGFPTKSQSRIDMREQFTVGTVIYGEVKGKFGPYISLTLQGPELGILSKGFVLEISPVKIPRFVGKRGSMINMIKDMLKCNILVGMNGRVWIESDEYEIIKIIREVIDKIERESHVSGLTDRVKNLIAARLKELGVSK